jgi:hypothetical protein
VAKGNPRAGRPWEICCIAHGARMDRPAQLGLTPALLGFRTVERWLAWVRV